MLVLTRKQSESLYIDNVKVTIVSIDNDKVRLGIDAPKSVRICREELLTETSAENPLAARSPLPTVAAASFLAALQPTSDDK